MDAPSTFSRSAVTVRSGHDFSQIKALVLNSVTSIHSRAAYNKALTDFLTWFMSGDPKQFNKATVQQWVSSLQAAGLAPATINLRVSVIRKLALEAADNGYMDPQIAQGILRARGVKRLGVRLGNWLTKEQAEELLSAPDGKKLKGKRDRAALAILLGCGLRRAELSDLMFSHMQQRDGRWAIVDMSGKGGKLRTIPMPAWAKMFVDQYVNAVVGAVDACVGALSTWPAPNARVFRPMNNKGKFTGNVWLPQNVFEMVKRYGNHIGVEIKPHDLRRTFAQLALKGKAALEQIQLSMGHASITTTERYLGVRQDLQDAPCDRLGLDINADEE